MPAAGHGVAVNLGLDVHTLDSVLLQPGNVNLHIKVADAREGVKARS